MNRGERLAPAAAAFSAVSTLLCCLPLSFAGALAAAAVSAAAMEYRSWLIGLSAVLLGVGFAQVYRRPAACARRSRITVAVLWLSAALVTVVLLMPQMAATLLADWLATGRMPAALLVDGPVVPAFAAAVGNSPGTPQAQADHVTVLKVEGMT